MDKYNTPRIVLKGTFYGLTWINDGLVNRPLMEDFKVQYLVLGIHIYGKKLLDLLARKFQVQVIYYILSPTDYGLGGRLFFQVLGADLFDEAYMYRTILAYPLDTLKLIYGCVEHTTKPLKTSYQELCQRFYVTPRYGIGEQELYYLVVVKPLNADLEESFTKPFPMTATADNSGGIILFFCTHLLRWPLSNKLRFN